MCHEELQQYFGPCAQNEDNGQEHCRDREPCMGVAPVCTQGICEGVAPERVSVLSTGCRLRQCRGEKHIIASHLSVVKRVHGTPTTLHQVQAHLAPAKPEDGPTLIPRTQHQVGGQQQVKQEELRRYRKCRSKTLMQTHTCCAQLWSRTVMCWTKESCASARAARDPARCSFVP